MQYEGKLKCDKLIKQFRIDLLTMAQKFFFAKTMEFANKTSKLKLFC